MLPPTSSIKVVSPTWTELEVGHGSLALPPLPEEPPSPIAPLALPPLDPAALGLPPGLDPPTIELPAPPTPEPALPPVPPDVGGPPAPALGAPPVPSGVVVCDPQASGPRSAPPSERLARMGRRRRSFSLMARSSVCWRCALGEAT